MHFLSVTLRAQSPTSVDGVFEYRENRGEAWLGWMTALAQWVDTGGIGLTIVAPSFHYGGSVVCGSPDSLLVVAMVGGGTFETRWAGPVVVAAAPIVRATDGYMEIMVLSIHGLEISPRR